MNSQVMKNRLEQFDANISNTSQNAYINKTTFVKKYKENFNLLHLKYSSQAGSKFDVALKRCFLDKVTVCCAKESQSIVIYSSALSQYLVIYAADKTKSWYILSMTKNVIKATVF